MAKWSRAKMRKARFKDIPKRWSSEYINAGQRVDTSRARSSTSEGGLGSTVLYRDHVKSSGSTKAMIRQDGKLTNVMQPQALHEPTPWDTFQSLRRYKDIPTKDVPPIIQVLRERISLKTWKSSQRGQGSVEWHEVVVLDKPYVKIFMYFSGIVYFFLEQDDMYNCIRRSCDYGSERAHVVMHNTNRIQWVEKFNLPKPTD